MTPEIAVLLREVRDGVRFGQLHGEQLAERIELMFSLAPEDEPQKVEYSAIALIPHYDRENTFLAVTARGEPLNLRLPGGKQEPCDNGSHWRAAVREVHEETDVTITSLREVYAAPSASGSRIVHCFIANTWTGVPRAKEDGIEVKWVRPEALLTPTCTFRDFYPVLFAHVFEPWRDVNWDCRGGEPDWQRCTRCNVPSPCIRHEEQEIPGMKGKCIFACPRCGEWALTVWGVSAFRQTSTVYVPDGL